MIAMRKYYLKSLFLALLFIITLVVIVQQVTISSAQQGGENTSLVEPPDLYPDCRPGTPNNIQLNDNFEFNVDARITNEEWCHFWAIELRGGDTIMINVEREEKDDTNQQVVPIVSFYGVSQGGNRLTLLESVFNFNSDNPGSQIKSIYQESLIYNGTYYIVLRRDGGEERKLNSLDNPNVGRVLIDGDVVRREARNVVSADDLEGRLPLADGGGLLTCQTENLETTGEPSIGLIQPNPLLDVTTGAGYINLGDYEGTSQFPVHDMGDRWLFYAEVGKPVEFILSNVDPFPVVGSTEDTNVVTLKASIWYEGDFVRNFDDKNPLILFRDGKTQPAEFTPQKSGWYTLILYAQEESGNPFYKNNISSNYQIDCLSKDNIVVPSFDNEIDGTHLGNGLFLKSFDDFDVIMQHGSLEFINVDDDDFITFVLGYKDIELEVDPDLFDWFYIVEDYLIAGLKPQSKVSKGDLSNIVVLQISYNISSSIRIVPDEANPEQILIRSQSNSKFISDWVHPQLMWYIDGRFSVQMYLPNSSVERSQPWLISTFSALQIMTGVDVNKDLTVIRRISASGESEDQIINTTWQGIDRILLNGTNQMIVDFENSSQFVTDILDEITLTRSEGNLQQQSISFSSNSSRIITSLERISSFTLSNQGVAVLFDQSVDASGNGITAPISGTRSTDPFQNADAFQNFFEETYGDITTPNYYIQRQNGERELFLNVGSANSNHIVAPAPPEEGEEDSYFSVIGHIPAQNQYVIPYPQEMNNLGEEFCDNCGASTVSWLFANPANGNLHYEVEDFRLPGYGFDMVLSRHYNSLHNQPDTSHPQFEPFGPQTATISSFGPGWASDLDIQLDVTWALWGNVTKDLRDENNRGFVILTTESGSRHVFYRAEDPVNISLESETYDELIANCEDDENGEGDYISYVSQTMRTWEVHQCANEWVLTRDDRTYRFDRSGALLTIQDMNGFALSHVWSVWEENNKDIIVYPDLAENLTTASGLCDAKFSNETNSNFEPAYLRILTSSFKDTVYLYYGYPAELGDQPENIRLLQAQIYEEGPNAARISYYYNSTGLLEHVIYDDACAASYKYENEQYQRLASIADPRSPYQPFLLFDYGSDGLGEVKSYNPATNNEQTIFTYTYRDDSVTLDDSIRNRTTVFHFEIEDVNNMLSRYRLIAIDEEMTDNSVTTTNFVYNPLNPPFPNGIFDTGANFDYFMVEQDSLALIHTNAEFNLDFEVRSNNFIRAYEMGRSEENLAFEYDEKNHIYRVIDSSYPDSTWTYLYDKEHGQLLQYADPVGNMYTYCYTKLELSDINWPSSASPYDSNQILNDTYVTMLTSRIGPYSEVVLAILGLSKEDTQSLCNKIEENQNTWEEAFVNLGIIQFDYIQGQTRPYVTEFEEFFWNSKQDLDSNITQLTYEVALGLIQELQSNSQQIRFEWGTNPNELNYGRLQSIVETNKDNPNENILTCYRYGNSLGELNEIIHNNGWQTEFTYREPFYAYRISEIVGSQINLEGTRRPQNCAGWDNIGNAVEIFEDTLTYTATTCLFDNESPECADNTVEYLYLSITRNNKFENDYEQDSQIIYRMDEFDRVDQIQVRERLNESEWASRMSCLEYDVFDQITAYGTYQNSCDLDNPNASNVNGNFFEFAYNDFYYLETIQSNANEWRISYPSDGTVVRIPKTVEFPFNDLSLAYTFDELWRVENITESDGTNNPALSRDTNIRYNPDGQLAAVLVDDEVLINYCYDTLGHLLSVRREPSRDENLDLCTLDYTHTIQEQFGYDERGNITEWIPQYRHESEWQAQYSFSYDGFNNPTIMIDPLGNTRTLAYDEQQRLMYNTDWNGILTRYEYLFDAVSKNYQVIECNTGQHIDDLTDLQSTSCFSSIVRLYSPNGLLQSETIGGQLIEYTYDEWGRLDTRLVRLGNGEIRNATKVFTYNEYDQLTSITNSLGASYDFTYDNYANLIAVQNPNGQSWQFAYANGNLISSRDSHNGDAQRQSHFYYDVLGRIDCIIFNDGARPDVKACSDTNTTDGLVKFEYDQGLLQAIDTYSSENNFTAPIRTTFGYDSNARLEQIISNPTNNGSQREKNYEYRAFEDDEKLLVVDYNLGDNLGQLSYYYDALGRLVRVDSTNADKINDWRAYAWYDGNGLLCGYQISSLVYQDNGEATLADAIDYSHSNTSCKIPEDSGALTAGNIFVFYEYDALGRMVKLGNSEQFIVYEYNPIDGHLQAIRNGVSNIFYRRIAREQGTTVYVIQVPSNETCELLTGFDEMQSSNDDKFNSFEDYLQSAEFKNCSLNRLDFDTEDNLKRFIQYESQNGYEMRSYLFNYDALGQLIQLTDPNGNSLSWIYDGLGNLLRITDENGTSLSIEYTDDRYRQIASISNHLGNRTEFEYDGFGNLSKITNDTQEAVFQSNEFGEQIQESSGDTNNHNKDVLYTYNPLGWIEKQVNVDNTSVEYIYNNRGQIIQLRQEDIGDNSSSRQFEYDALGNITQVRHIGVYSYEYEYSYNSYGEIISVPSQYRQEQDTIQSLEMNINHLTGQREMLLIKNDDNTLFCLDYDYNSQNQLVYMLLFKASEASEYNEDCENVETEENDEVNFVRVKFRYNAYGDLVSMERSGTGFGLNSDDNILTSIEHDDDGHITHLIHQQSGSKNELVAEYRYNLYTPNGSPQQVFESHIGAEPITYNSRTIFYSYDLLGRISGERWLDSNESLIYSYSVSYTPEGHRQTVNENGRTEYYCYSPDKRILAILEANQCEQLLTELNDIGAESAIACNGAYEYLFNFSGRVIAYDELNRLCRIAEIQDNAIANDEKYNYDALGRLIMIDSDGADAIPLIYNSENKPYNPNELGSILFDGERLLRYQDGTDTNYVFMTPDEDALPLFQLSINQQGNIEGTWLITDGFNSIRRERKFDGEYTSSSILDYNAFGNPITDRSVGVGVGVRFQAMFLQAGQEQKAGQEQNRTIYTIDGAAYHSNLGQFLQPQTDFYGQIGKRYSFLDSNLFVSDNMFSMPNIPQIMSPQNMSFSGYLTSYGIQSMPDNTIFAQARQDYELGGMAYVNLGHHLQRNWQNGGLRWVGLPQELYIGRLIGQSLQDYRENEPVNAIMPEVPLVDLQISYNSFNFFEPLEPKSANNLVSINSIFAEIDSFSLSLNAAHNTSWQENIYPINEIPFEQARNLIEVINTRLAYQTNMQLISALDTQINNRIVNTPSYLDDLVKEMYLIENDQFNP